MRKAVLLAATLLAACSSGPTGTTPKQAARIVAAHATAIRAAIDYENHCDTSDCLAAEARFNRYDALQDKANALAQDLRARQPYNPEIADLVTRTLDVTDTLGAARNETTMCFEEHQGGTLDDCATQVAAYEMAWRALGPALDAWQPYL